MYRDFRMCPVTVDEFNKILEDNEDIYSITYGKPDTKVKLDYRMFINTSLSKISLYIKKGSHCIQYITRLDGAENDQYTNGGVALRTLMNYYKIPEYPNIWLPASPLIWFNKKYNKTRQHAHYYDLNSAYATIMYKYKFPDTSVPPKSGFVGKDEIGFTYDGDKLVHEGRYADYIFPLMDSPFKKFAEVWYNKKKNATTPEEKLRAKGILNYSVQMLSRRRDEDKEVKTKNTFLRLFIMESCKEYIKSLMDENTLYCNTDCLVSLTERPELEIGTEIGQWKHKEGEFAYIGATYQWNLETPVWRHIPRGWWKDKTWDILVDGCPHSGNIYKFDSRSNRIVNEDN